MGLTQRLLGAYKGFMTTPHQGAKSWGGSALSGLTGWMPNGDLSQSSMGLAQSYTLVEAVRVSVDLYADLVESVPWTIYENASGDPDNDTEVSASTDIRPRHPLDIAMNRYRRKYNMSLLRHIAYSTLLYDETYLWLIRNNYGWTTDLCWLNPLGIEIDDYTGKITGYRYSDRRGNYLQLGLRDVAYDHGFNAEDDFRGSSTIMAALDTININRNFKRFLRDWFANGSRPDFIAYLTDDKYAGNKQAIEALKSEFQKFARGSGNRFNGFFSSTPLTFQPFEQPETDRQYATNIEIRKEIFAAFGVPLALVGDTSNTNYKETEDVRASFIQMKVKPLLERIATFFNDSVLPVMMGSEYYRIEFDFSEFNLMTDNDLRKADMARADVQTGIISLGEGREARGYDPDDELADIYIIGGQPMSKTILLKVANTMPSRSVLDLSQAFGAISQAAPKPEVAQLPSLTATNSTGAIVDELKAWRKVAKRGVQKAITRFQTYHVPEHIDQWIRDELMDGTDVASMFDDAMFSVVKATFATKGFEDTSASFVREIKQIISDAQSDSITRSKFGGAMRSALRRYGLIAFRQGLESEGYSSESLGPDELEAFRKWQTTTSGYISDFGAEIFKEGGITEAQVALRSEFWVNKSLREIYYQGVLLAADPATLKRWVRNPNKDSCVDCIARDGQVLTMEKWEKLGLPGSDLLDCQGYYCGCELEEAQGQTKSYDIDGTFDTLKAVFDAHHAEHSHMEAAHV